MHKNGKEGAFVNLGRREELKRKEGRVERRAANENGDEGASVNFRRR